MALRNKCTMALKGRLSFNVGRLFSSSENDKTQTKESKSPIIAPIESIEFEDAEGVSVVSRVVRIDKSALTPHQYWVTQGKGNERPFTGKYHDYKEIGTYSCSVCNSDLFLSSYKFFPKSGVASFWRSIDGSTELKEDSLPEFVDMTNVIKKRELTEHPSHRVTCNTCKSHLGLVFIDGPPPTFLRYSINSGAINFAPKPWFEDPVDVKRKRKEMKELQIKRKREEYLNRKEFDKKKYYDVVDKGVMSERRFQDK